MSLHIHTNIHMHTNRKKKKKKKEIKSNYMISSSSSSSSSSCQIVAHVCLVDESCPGGRLVTTSTKMFKARRPACFMLSRLLPGERYIVGFSGIKRADALSRVADFKTVDLANREVQLKLKFSHDTHMISFYLHPPL
jgi:hypothetical protein